MLGETSLSRILKYLDFLDRSSFTSIQIDLGPGTWAACSRLVCWDGGLWQPQPPSWGDNISGLWQKSLGLVGETKQNNKQTSTNKHDSLVETQELRKKPLAQKCQVTWPRSQSWGWEGGGFSCQASKQPKGSTSRVDDQRDRLAAHIENKEQEDPL